MTAQPLQSPHSSDGVFSKKYASAVMHSELCLTACLCRAHWDGFVESRQARQSCNGDGWLLPTQGLYNVAPIDGIWLDMNEVSNYCSGDVCVDPGKLLQSYVLPCLP